MTRRQEIVEAMRCWWPLRKQRKVMHALGAAAARTIEDRLFDALNAGR